MRLAIEWSRKGMENGNLGPIGAVVVRDGQVLGQGHNRCQADLDITAHGEMVAMGTLAQLMMESRPDEASRVAEFFAKVGLPIHLGQLSLDPSDARALEVVIEGTLAFPFIGNMPMPVTAELVRSAILDAHRMGLTVAEHMGDGAYRRLHQG